MKTMDGNEAALARKGSDVPEVLVQMHSGIVPEITVDFPDSTDYNGILTHNLQPIIRRSASTVSLAGLLNQTGRVISDTMTSALETSGVSNAIPNNKQLEFLIEPARQGVTKVRNRLAGKDATLSKTSEGFNNLPREWRSVFFKLDRRDGKFDFRIKKADFINWISELDEDSAFSLGNDRQVTKPKLQSWVSNIDEDKDAYISHEEWVTLVGIMEQEEDSQEIEHVKIDIDTEDEEEYCPLNCLDEIDGKNEADPKSKTLRKMSAIYTKGGLDYCNMNSADQMALEEKLQMRENVRTIMGRQRIRARLRKYTINAAHARQLRWWPPPVFTILVSIIQLVMYVYHVHHRIEVHGEELSWNGPTPYCSTLIYDPSRRWEVARYGTYSLVHVGAEHITFNLVMQLALGIPLEMFNSYWRVALVYMGGVIAGSVATSTLDPQMFLAGASGGVYALITAHLSSLILNWKEDRLILRQQIMHGRHNSPVHGELFRLIKLVSVVFFAAVDTGLAIYARHYSEDESSTGYIAHLAGALAGLTVGIMVLKNRKSEVWESWLRLGCVFLFSVLMASGIVWNVVASDVLKQLNMTNSSWNYLPSENFHTDCDEYIDYDYIEGVANSTDFDYIEDTTNGTIIEDF